MRPKYEGRHLQRVKSLDETFSRQYRAFQRNFIMPMRLDSGSIRYRDLVKEREAKLARFALRELSQSVFEQWWLASYDEEASYQRFLAKGGKFSGEEGSQDYARPHLISRIAPTM
jgi:hypothetical protein